MRSSWDGTTKVAMHASCQVDCIQFVVTNQHEAHGTLPLRTDFRRAAMRMH